MSLQANTTCPIKAGCARANILPIQATTVLEPRASSAIYQALPNRQRIHRCKSQTLLPAATSSRAPRMTSNPMIAAVQSEISATEAERTLMRASRQAIQHRDWVLKLPSAQTNEQAKGKEKVRELENSYLLCPLRCRWNPNHLPHLTVQLQVLPRPINRFLP